MGDLTVYRLDENRILCWLSKKVDRLVEFIKNYPASVVNDQLRFIASENLNNNGFDSRVSEFTLGITFNFYVYVNNLIFLMYILMY